MYEEGAPHVHAGVRKPCRMRFKYGSIVRRLRGIEVAHLCLLEGKNRCRQSQTDCSAGRGFSSACCQTKASLDVYPTLSEYSNERCIFLAARI